MVDKSISKILYVFNDHIKSSNDFVRDLFGRVYDFDGDKIYSHKIKNNKLYNLSKFYFDKPQLIDANKLLFIQKVKIVVGEKNKNDSKFNTLQNVVYYDKKNTNKKDIDPVSEGDFEIELRDRKTLKNYLFSGKTSDFNFKTDQLVEYNEQINTKYFKINSFYNFYIESYEKLFNLIGNSIPETALPNFYIFSLVKDKSILDSITQSDFDSTSIESNNSAYKNAYKNFDKLITLNGNLSLGGNIIDTTNEALSVLDYYNAYGQTFNSTAVNLIETIEKRLGVSVSNIIDPEAIKRLNALAGQFPMYVDLEFYSDLNSPFMTWLIKNNIAVKAFQDFINSDLLIKSQQNANNDFVIKNTFYQIIKDVTQEKIKFSDGNENLLMINFNNWFDNIMEDLSDNTNNVAKKFVFSKPESVTQNTSESIEQSKQIVFFDPSKTISNDNDEINISEMDFVNLLTSNIKYNELIKSNFRTYEQIINGELAKTEVLCFKIEKRDSSNNLIQTFFVLNIPNLQIENFIDTQVKYGKDYKYKIYAWNLVYGTKYEYHKYIPPKNKQEQESNVIRNLNFIPNSGNEQEDNFDFEIKPSDEWGSSSDEESESKIPKTLKKKSPIKMIKSTGLNTESTTKIPRMLPVDANFPVGDIDGRPQVKPDSNAEESENSINKEQEKEIYEFNVHFYPEIKIIETLFSDEKTTRVIDKPPPAPSISFIDFINNPEFVFAFQPTVGNYREKPKFILSSDVEKFVKQIVAQNSTDMKVWFKDEGGIEGFEIFKIDFEPTKWTDFKFYKKINFKTQSTLTELNEYGKTFYYTFRSVDVHENISNPTEIYKVTTINNDGFIYQEFDVFEMKPGQNKQKEKYFKKYLKISPSLFQKTYNYDSNNVGLLPFSIYNKQYQLKITSKHTNKCVKINLKFNKNDINN